jgi:hypothetical protein
MKKVYLLLLLALLLAGCAAPGAIKEKATSFLKGPCLDLFNKGWPFGYQHFAHQFRARAVFAYADVSAGTVCGTASQHDVIDPKWEFVETLAIARCEEAKKTLNSPNEAPCKIFARNNEIVIDKNEIINLQ